MGMYHSTFFAFGAKIAEEASDMWELIDEFEASGRYNTLLRVNDVGYLLAGNYDHDKLFLTTHCASADLGDYKRVDPFSLGEQEGEWKATLEHVAAVLNVELLEEPAWFVIADLS